MVTPTFPVLVPPPNEKATASPPVARSFPAASRACSVRVEVAPDAIVAADTVIVEVATDTPPVVTEMVGSVVLTATPPIVAPIVVAVPAPPPVPKWGGVPSHAGGRLPEPPTRYERMFARTLAFRGGRVTIEYETELFHGPLH